MACNKAAMKFTASHYYGVRPAAVRLRTPAIQLYCIAVCNDGADTCANATTSALLMFVVFIVFILLLPLANCPNRSSIFNCALRCVLKGIQVVSTGRPVWSGLCHNSSGEWGCGLMLNYL